MREPVEIFGLAAIAVASVLRLPDLMFDGASRAAPIGLIRQFGTDFRVSIEPVKGCGIGIIKIEDQPMCAQFKVMGGEIGNLAQGGLDGGNDAPFDLTAHDRKMRAVLRPRKQ